MRLLVSRKTYLLFNDNASSSIKKFTSYYIIIYGPEYISYNVHNLVH